MKKNLTKAFAGILALGLLTGCGAKQAAETTAAAEATTKAETAAAETTAAETTAKETRAEEKETKEAATEDEFQASVLFCGSTSLYPIMSSLASSFTEKYVTWDQVDASFPKKNISIYVAPGGSGVGVAAAVDNTADFGMVARAMKDSEVEALGENYQDFIVARDALTVSVNVANPICDVTDDLSTDMIRKIFAGEITTWNEVDTSLPEETINVYIRDLSGGAYEVFQTAVMGDSEVTASATQSASMTELATNIANDQWGIGYAGFGAYQKVNADGEVLKAMKVDGIEASVENIVSDTYTIQRPVMFVTGQVLTASEQAFVDYVFSQVGYDVTEANGYIPAFTVAQ